MKRIMSLILAVGLVLSLTTITTFAETAPLGSSANGEGNTLYLDTELYRFVLPTDNHLDFTLDPLGLYDLEDGTKLSELVGGKVIGRNPAMFINNSSVPVKITTEIKVTGDADVVADQADIELGASNNILLYVAPSTVALGTSGGAADPAPYAPTEKGFTLGTSSITMDFVMPAAEYTLGTSSDAPSGFTMTFDVDSGQGNGLKIGGFVNSTADWSDFAGNSPSKQVGITVVFSFAKDQTAYDEADYDEGGGKFMLGFSDVPVADRITADFSSGRMPSQIGFFVNSGDANVISSNDYETTSTAVDVTIPFYFGTGSWQDFSLESTWTETSPGSDDWVDVSEYVDITEDGLVYHLDGVAPGTYTYGTWLSGSAFANDARKHPETGFVCYYVTIVVTA